MFEKEVAVWDTLKEGSRAVATLHSYVVAAGVKDESYECFLK